MTAALAPVQPCARHTRYLAACTECTAAHRARQESKR